ncbi:MAG TPA: S8 family serine peptidase [Blastocatellia bacterium]|jgi:subtilisin family serine protease|nr:S8 family serine peptidase [Blastocatellia bacterium]
MHKIRIAFLPLIIALVVIAPQPRASRAEAVKERAGRAAGEIVVKLKQGALAPSSNEASPEPPGYGEGRRMLALARSMGERAAHAHARSAEPLVSGATDRDMAAIISRRGLDRVFVLRFEAGADIDSAIAELKASPEVEYAEPNYKVVPGSVTPNDPEFELQWGLQNRGQGVGGFNSTRNADIKATEAWGVTTGSPGVVVAITDTGLDRTHPDLANNVFTNTLEVPDNGIDDDRNGYVDDVHGFNLALGNGDTRDVLGHGTQMAGIIAAEMNNGAGISGIAQCKILPVVFFKKTGPFAEEVEATVVDASRALIYSIAAGAAVINASWRTLLPVDEVTPAEANMLRDAVAATNDAGVLLVCISGNEGYDNDFSKVYPGNYQMFNQIVVAASDYNDQIIRGFPFSFVSGIGQRTVHLAAPGANVVTTAARGDCLLCSDSEDPADWYTQVNGTSASAAFVSGVAALVKSKYPDDGAILIKRRILESVDVGPQLGPYVSTSGRLNAVAALNIQITVSSPVFTKFQYKKGSGKLFVFGEGLQSGLAVLVGGKSYTTKVKSGKLLASVPSSMFPPGTPVEIRLRNPDGGTSQALTLTR